MKKYYKLNKMTCTFQPSPNRKIHKTLGLNLQIEVCSNYKNCVHLLCEDQLVYLFNTTKEKSCE